MTERQIIEVLAAFCGSLGFSIVFHVRKDRVFFAGLGGFLSWAVYHLMGIWFLSDVPRFFVSSVVVTVYAEILARVMKCPATLFLVIGTIPLIPGGGLYRTMRFFMLGDYAACSKQGLTTVFLAVAIAVGMLLPSSLFHVLRKFRWRKLTVRQALRRK